ATMFLADILWSIAKVGGFYVPGDLQDVFYLACYLPWAAAGREQIRESDCPAEAVANPTDVFTRALPYAAMLTAMLVLVY
ncbi:hypothetical protein ABTL72_19655, partial [Acinetobacter baumannii]